MIPLWLSQLLGITRYEFLLHWRRRALVIVFLSALAIPVVGGLTARRDMNEISGSWVQTGQYSTEDAARVMTTSLTLLTWAPMFLVFLIVLPIAAADSIPRDRQLGVYELLNTTPISLPIYLIGKMLGLWLSLLVGIVTGLTVIGVFWWFVLGPFEIATLIEIGLIAAVPLAFIQSGIALLIAAGQSTGRRAILMGVTLGIIGLTTLLPGLQAADVFWRNFNLSRPVLFIYYIWVRFNAPMPGGYPSPTIADVWATIGWGLLQLALVGFIIYAWMRWQEKRA
jgi:ABC-type transport system involved in multi-copper enzyme maturation permease subunit